MFIEAIIFAIIIGYIFKGKIKNLENVQIKNLSLIFIAFSIELITIVCVRNNILSAGKITFFMDITMYMIIFIFVFINKKNTYILLMGIGFILNAIPIFLNGGAMPVSAYAAKTAGLTLDVRSQGLYLLIDQSTRAALLGDIIPLTFLRHFAISIGDIIAAFGLMLFIITGMKAKTKIEV